ncbi:MAG: hypothetical protein ACF8XB_22550 [Planctomycetota bacterium JB042]
MLRLSPFLVLTSFALAPAATAADDEAPRALYDTLSHLPERALARLGSTRLRHDGSVVGHLLLRDGTLLATTAHDRTVRTWDLATGRLQGRVDLASDDGVPTMISRIDDENFLVSTLAGKLIRFDAELARTDVTEIERLVRVTSAPGGRRFAGAAEQSGEVELIDEAGETALTIDSGAQRAVAWRFSADGRRLAIAGWNLESRHTGTAHLRLVDLETGEPIVDLGLGESYVQSLAFSPDEKRVAVGAGDGSLRVVDLESSVLSEPQNGHETAILVTEWSADGRWIATGSSRDGRISVYDGESGGFIHTFVAHAQSVAAIGFTPDGSGLVTSSSDSRIRVFETETGAPRVDLPGHTGPVRCVDWSPDGRWVVTGGYDGTARLWDAESWVEARTLRCGPGPVNDIAFSPDGEQLAAVSQDAFLRVFSLETGEPHFGVSDGEFAIFDVAWSPDGLRLATAHADGKFRLHDALSGRVLGRRQVGHGFCFSVAFSPDGKKLAAASSTIGVWDTEDLESLRPLEGPNAPVSKLVFDADGKLWSASADRRVIRWDLPSAKPEIDFVAHPSRVQWLTISKDQKLLATCGYGENTLRIWSAETGEELDSLVGHANIPGAVAFDPAGGRLASVAMDSNGLIWKLR